jgi:ubiquinone/menaquinone biosynthesis C-methylase UbiE
VLNHLLDGAIDYTGVDYSPAMIAMARRCRPDHSFGVADATRLPFADGGFDVVLNGVSLMHIYRYEAAITETARVADQWCILHSVPILERRATTFLTKQAYGQLTVEVIFNRDELIDLVRKAGFRLAHDQPSIAYDLEPVLGEHTQTRTYLCKRAGI